MRSRAGSDGAQGRREFFDFSAMKSAGEVLRKRSSDRSHQPRRVPMRDADEFNPGQPNPTALCGNRLHEEAAVASSLRPAPPVRIQLAPPTSLRFEAFSGEVRKIARVEWRCARPIVTGRSNGESGRGTSLSPPAAPRSRRWVGNLANNRAGGIVGTAIGAGLVLQIRGDDKLFPGVPRAVPTTADQKTVLASHDG
jgi:hypothetical protein